MSIRKALSFWTGFLGACLPLTHPGTSSARRAIAHEIELGVEATRTKDIDAYMAQLPEDADLRDQGGRAITLGLYCAVAHRPDVRSHVIGFGVVDAARMCQHHGTGDPMRIDVENRGKITAPGVLPGVLLERRRYWPALEILPVAGEAPTFAMKNPSAGDDHLRRYGVAIENGALARGQHVR